ncbi:MAG: FtsK/SpoIIIE domain-containing protein [Aggregatilineales bacterium]
MSEQATAELISRPPRHRPPPLQGTLDLPAPPAEQPTAPLNALVALLPSAGVALLGSFYLLLGGASAAWLALPTLALGILGVFTALISYAASRRQAHLARWRSRRDYHRLLDRRLARLQAARDLQQLQAERLTPPATQLLKCVAQPSHQLWCRRPTDADFTLLRLGTGKVRSAVSIRAPDPDLLGEEARRAQAICFEYCTLPNAPIAIRLRAVRALGIVGTLELRTNFAYALIAQLAALHAPSELSLYLFSSKLNHPAWRWMRWLPHTSSTQRGGFPDQIAFEPEQARQLIAQLARQLDTGAETPLRVAVFEDVSSIRDEISYQRVLDNPNLCALYLCSRPEDVPSAFSGVLTLSGSKFRLLLPDDALEGTAESLKRTEVEFLARQMASYRLPQLGQVSRLPTQLSILQLYGVERIQHLGIEANWARPVPADGVLPLPVPIGNASFSAQQMLDLSERAHGPHGIIGGTTGSGKSELLQTLVAALAIEHHPYLLNFLLIDYKGGATFNVFRRLPHTVGIITNLNEREALRALAAIQAENRRRQQFLADQNVENITEYHRRLRRYGGMFPPDWQPLPHLVIVVDEFAELTSSLPKFLDELVATVRVGRSLGMHLVLATQRPSGHVTAEMKANLNFRICLRVQAPDESQEILRRPDAAFLPPDVPGRAYFQVGSALQQFQAARVGIDYAESQPEAEGAPTLQVLRLEQATNLLPVEADPEPPAVVPTLAEALADYLATRYTDRPPEPVLLESLPPQLSLADVLHKGDYGGWDGSLWRPAGTDRAWACAPIGLLDDLGRRAQPPLHVNFARDGHFLAIGGPASGKTTLLHTLALSLAHLFTPSEVALYIVSFGGRALDTLMGLPHVGAVIGSNERERLSRLLRYLLDALEQRRYALASLHAADLETYNRRRSADQPFLPALFILVDNFAELWRTLESDSDEAADWLRLLRDGRTVGIHFALTAPAVNLPYSVLNLIESRFALRLPERGDYLALLGRLPERESDPRPGSGVLAGRPPLHAQIALPNLAADDDERDRALVMTIQAMRAAWAERPTPEPIRSMPESVPLDLHTALEHLPPRCSQPQAPRLEPLRSWLGVEGNLLRPFLLHWRDAPHWLILGGYGSGRSSLLRTLLLGVAARYAPCEAAFVLIDLSREALRPLRHLPHILSYATDPASLSQALKRLQAELIWRHNALMQLSAAEDEPNSADAQPFMPIILAIDDYDQLQEALATEQFEQLDALSAWLRHDARLGLHAIASGQTLAMQRSGDAFLKALRACRSGMVLGEVEGVEVLGGRLTAAVRRTALPLGRGYWLRRGALRLIQFAHAAHPRRLAHEIAARWANFPPAMWVSRPELPRAPTAPRLGSAGFDLNFTFDLEGALEDYRKQQGYT